MLGWNTGHDVEVRAANAGLTQGTASTDSCPPFPLCSAFEVNGGSVSSCKCLGRGSGEASSRVLARTEGRGARSGPGKLVVGSLQA